MKTDEELWEEINYDVFVVVTIHEKKDMDVQVFKSLDKAHEYQEGEATNEKGSYSVVYPLHYMDK